MPTYNSKCHHCGKVFEFIKKIDDRDDTPICCYDKKTERVLLKGPMGVVDNPAFMSQYKKMY